MTTVKGIALAPGVSRNGRLYTREAIARAYARLSERVRTGASPVVMRTHHDAGDDSTRVVGRVQDVTLTGDGAIAYTATLADTAAGRDIAALAEGNDRALAHVSIYGSWVGTPRRIDHDGATVETADDLEIDKIDFTATPGVLGASARVETFTPSTDPGILSESMRPIRFADDHATAEAMTDAAPASSCMSLSACVAGFDLNVCAYGIDPADLDAYTDTAQEAIAAACAILSAGPADDDGDASTETHQPPTSPVGESQGAAMADITTPVEQAETAAPTETVETPAAGIDYDKLAAAIAAAIKDTTGTTDSAPAETAAAPDAPTAETITWEPDGVAKLTETIKADIVADLVKEGVIKPTRKGAGLTETESTVDPAEAWERRGDAFAAALGFPAAD